MSTLPLPKVLSQRKTNSLDLERENFEKSQTISISKAINAQESPVKEKHVRSAIIGTFHEKGATTFWNVVIKLPLQGNPIVCWKFCHVVHKLLREGHQRVIPDSQRYKQTFVDLGKLWGLLKEGYGKLIQGYCKLIEAKLNFHSRNPRFPGNLIVSDEDLDDIGERDVNVFFQLTCEMFDYMDEILALQLAVFGSLDMSRSNSMTNSGQCRLACLIPCIQDSSQLYDYIVKVMFKLHSALPADTLIGHRERFLKQFIALQTFYLNSINLQYFKHLIQVPLLPETPPNFLVASDITSHVSPVVILPPQNDTPDSESVDMSLVDTSVPSSTASPSKFDEVFGNGGMGDFNFQKSNGSASPDHLNEKDKFIEQLLKEISDLKMEIQRIKIEDQRAMDDLNRHIAALESQIAEDERTIKALTKEKEQLESDLAAASTDKEASLKIVEFEKKSKANEEKFLKMKEVYQKLREEHIGLLRTKAEIEKQMSSSKAAAESAEQTRLELQEKLQSILSEKTVVGEKLQKSSDKAAELTVFSLENDQLKCEVKTLQEEIQQLKDNKNRVEQMLQGTSAEKENLMQQMSELSARHEENEIQLKKNNLNSLFQMLVGVVIEAENIVYSSLEDFDNPGNAGLTSTPEQFLQVSEPCINALENLRSGHLKFVQDSENIEDLIRSVFPFAHILTEILKTGKATSQASPNIEQGEDLANACRSLGQDTLNLLKYLKSEDSANEVQDWTTAVDASLKEVVKCAELLSSDALASDSQKLGDMVEEELQQMDKAIEEAANRIQEMISKSQAGDSGIKLEVNGKILDACTGLMKAIKELVRSSKDLQGEIVARGQGSASRKEFYNRNHRWTEGLISAAKVVGIGANFLVDAADKVVNGQAKFEELVVASQEIAGATAQLVVASKVKAERGSAKLGKLSKASKGVTENTGNVVATAKNCAQLIEESEVLDFSKLTLHQAKRKEMDSQVKVLQLENSLEKERLRLAGLRKQHYHLAGASEGWDVEESQ